MEAIPHELRVKTDTESKFGTYACRLCRRNPKIDREGQRQKDTKILEKNMLVENKRYFYLFIFFLKNVCRIYPSHNVMKKIL